MQSQRGACGVNIHESSRCLSSNSSVLLLGNPHCKGNPDHYGGLYTATDQSTLGKAAESSHGSQPCVSKPSLPHPSNPLPVFSVSVFSFSSTSIPKPAPQSWVRNQPDKNKTSRTERALAFKGTDPYYFTPLCP